MKIDRRKNYYLMLDTETANTLDDPLVYDIGLAVVDKTGKIYECYSFIIYEIFCQCKDLMQTAYYSDKLENYEDDIANGLRKIVTFATARSVANIFFIPLLNSFLVANVFVLSKVEKNIVTANKLTVQKNVRNDIVADKQSIG